MKARPFLAHIPTRLTGSQRDRRETGLPFLPRRTGRVGWTECVPLQLREQTLRSKVLTSFCRWLSFGAAGLATDNEISSRSTDAC